MKRTHLHLSGLALAAFLSTGCNNGPPGGGITNGPPPDLTAEKAAMRTDQPERNRTDTGEMNGAAGSAGIGSTTSGSTPAVNPAPRTGDARKDTVEAVGSASAQPPFTKSPGSAAGATKPSGDIKVGTPKGPQ